MSEVEFVAGMLVKPPSAQTPVFVKARISIKVDEFVPWLKAKMAAKEEWINLDIMESRDGVKWYAKVNTWKPEDKKPAPKPSDPFDDAPF